MKRAIAAAAYGVECLLRRVWRAASDLHFWFAWKVSMQLDHWARRGKNQ